MFTEYIDQRLKHASYKLLKNGLYFGEIGGLKGVWASAKQLEGCREELKEVLEDWILLKVRDGERIPNFSIRFDRRQLVPHA